MDAVSRASVSWRGSRWCAPQHSLARIIRPCHSGRGGGSVSSERDSAVTLGERIRSEWAGRRRGRPAEHEHRVILRRPDLEHGNPRQEDAVGGVAFEVAVSGITYEEYVKGAVTLPACGVQP